MKSFSLLLIFITQVVFAQDRACDTHLQDQAAVRTRNFSIMGYNVENLFMRAGAHERMQDGSLRRIDKGQRNREKFKSTYDLQREAAIINGKNPDFLVLTEVEDDAAHRFSKEYLNDAYNVFSIPGNDQRGINIAVLVKKSLNMVGEYRSHKNLTWDDPASRQVQPIFSRDFPVLILRESKTQQPFLIIAGNLPNLSVIALEIQSPLYGGTNSTTPKQKSFRT